MKLAMLLPYELVYIAVLITVCEGFHWPAYPRFLSQRQQSGVVLLAKPAVGDVFNAKVDRIDTSSENPHAEFMVSSMYASMLMMIVLI